jgi:hypothetical protein
MTGHEIPYTGLGYVQFVHSVKKTQGHCSLMSHSVTWQYLVILGYEHYAWIRMLIHVWGLEKKHLCSASVQWDEPKHVVTRARRKLDQPVTTTNMKSSLKRFETQSQSELIQIPLLHLSAVSVEEPTRWKLKCMLSIKNPLSPSCSTNITGYIQFPIINTWRCYQQLYELGLATCSNSELLLKLWIGSLFGRTPWKGDQSDVRPLHPQDSTMHKDEDKHPV